jgi:hypothetical protein
MSQKVQATVVDEQEVERVESETTDLHMSRMNPLPPSKNTWSTLAT